MTTLDILIAERGGNHRELEKERSWRDNTNVLHEKPLVNLYLKPTYKMFTSLSFL